MWWRFTVAVLMLVTIVAAGVLVQGHIDRVCQSIADGLAMSIQSVAETGSDQTPGLSQAHRLWEKSLSLFCTYVIHDQVDMVNETFQRAMGQLEMGGEEYLATLRELRFWIGVMQNYDRPTVRSIF